MATTQGSLVVNLGAQKRVVDERIASGAYASVDEVIQAGLQALDREESDQNAWLVRLAEESLADPRPDVPAEEVFAEIYAMHRQRKIDSAR